MNFRKVWTVAGLLLRLVTVSAPAHAENEGGGDPFPFQAVSQSGPAPRYAADAGRERFPDLSGRLTLVPEPVRFLAVVGQEAPVQSAASVPAGFDGGTVQFAQARGVERYQAARRAPAKPFTVASAGR